MRPLHDNDDDGLRRLVSVPPSEILGVAQIYVSSSFLLFLHFSRKKDFDSTQIFAVREFVRELKVLELSLFASLSFTLLTKGSSCYTIGSSGEVYFSQALKVLLASPCSPLAPLVTNLVKLSKYWGLKVSHFPHLCYFAPTLINSLLGLDYIPLLSARPPLWDSIGPPPPEAHHLATCSTKECGYLALEWFL